MFDVDVHLTEAEVAARAELAREAIAYYHQERARLQAEARREAGALEMRELVFHGPAGAGNDELQDLARQCWNDAALVIEAPTAGATVTQTTTEGEQA